MRPVRRDPRRDRDPYPEFQRSLAACGPPARLLVACSGGPDSMALLDLAERWRGETGARLFVGHVDHGLRGRASAADAAFVRAQAKRRGAPFALARLPRRRRLPEEHAREQRYRALARLARRFRCSAVLAGHTLDDQVETFFLNMIRGAGPSGLSAMAPEAPWPAPAGAPLRLIRPLLAVRRSSLGRYLRRRNVPSRRDATNDRPLYFRNRVRPVLRRWDRLRPGFFDRVGRLAGLLRDEEDYWRRLLTPRASTIRLDRRSFLRYHVAEQRRRLRHVYGLSRFDSLERVRAFAADNTPGPLFLPEGTVAKGPRLLVFHPRGQEPAARKGR